MANNNVKKIGKIGNNGNIINIPILAEEDGTYVIKTSNSTRVSSFNCHAKKGSSLYVPNINGQKRLYNGFNKIIIYTPGGQRYLQDENGIKYGVFLLELFEFVETQRIVFSDNNGIYYIPYMKNGNLIIDECDIEDYPNSLIISYPF